MNVFRYIPVLVGLSALLLASSCSALQNFLPKFPSPFQTGSTGTSPFQSPKASSAREVEDKLLAALENVGRLDVENSENIKSLVLALEEDQKSASIPEPAIAKEVYGRWRLLYTTNAETASPIQRKAVDTSKFAIYQDVVVRPNNQLVVSQVVKFSDSAELCVDALASTAAYPLSELTERERTGKILGLNILGVSLVGNEAEPDPSRPNSRIDFVFDEGKFDFGNWQLPYPVPFRSPLFRDAVKGWIDITYLSERLRISRGNKGSTFILVKE